MPVGQVVASRTQPVAAVPPAAQRRRCRRESTSTSVSATALTSFPTTAAKHPQASDPRPSGTMTCPFPTNTVSHPRTRHDGKPQHPIGQDRSAHAVLHPTADRRSVTVGGWPVPHHGRPDTRARVDIGCAPPHSRRSPTSVRRPPPDSSSPHNPHRARGGFIQQITSQTKEGQECAPSRTPRNKLSASVPSRVDEAQHFEVRYDTVGRKDHADIAAWAVLAGHHHPAVAVRGVGGVFYLRPERGARRRRRTRAGCDAPPNRLWRCCVRRSSIKKPGSAVSW
jgi:hypothetical protein